MVHELEAIAPSRRDVLVHRWVIVVFALSSVFACGQTPVPSAGGAWTVESRGAPAVVIRLNGVDALRLKCQETTIVKAGESAPALPWVVEVRRASDGGVLYSERISELPRWLLIYGEQVLSSASPMLGPAGPQCP